MDLPIKDFGDILFAENDRRSKYIRVPFTPMINDSKATFSSLFRKLDSLEFYERIDSNDHLTTTEFNENHLRSKKLAESVVNLMRYGWKLPSPQLIISVTGGAHLFKLSTPRARNAFQRGLIAAAVTTDAWIITGGTYAGVMKEVGDAVDKRRYKNTKTPSKVQCIGIGSWYYTTDHQYLAKQLSEPSIISVHPTTSLKSFEHVLSSDNTNFECITSTLTHIPRNFQSKTTLWQNIQIEQTPKVYRIRTPSSNENSCPLDPNHTHFILLDDMLGENVESIPTEFSTSVNCRADLTIKPRTEIEHTISEIYDIPIVQILANGGASSVLTVCYTLQQGTPVIVIEGTGRAADEIAREYRYLYGNQSTKYGEQRSLEIYNRASSKFEPFANRLRSTSRHHPVLNHTNLEQFIQQLTSREGYFLILIFQFYTEEGEQKLDDAILHALFNAAKLIQNEGKQRITELKLAMAWNKFDRIQRNILTDKTIFQWTDLELDQALRDSIRMNNIRCADLLIEYGASFDRLPRLNLLEKLYQDETDVLPYSQHILENMHRREESFNWSRFDKTYFYEDYLNVTQDVSLNWGDSSTVKYGLLDDENLSTNLESHFEHAVCVFNAIDMIQINGFLNTISIRFDSTKLLLSNRSLVCYLISPTDDLNSFLIVHKCQLRLVPTIFSDIHQYKTIEKQIFVTSGQYIAIGFTPQTGFPCAIPQRNQHSINLNQIINRSPTAAKQPIQFKVNSQLGVAISFTIDPVPTFFRDLFLWSLFFKHHKMVTYLCSRSSNTTIAALLASKVYHQAAQLTIKHEERINFFAKQKEFETHASMIIDMCFAENEQFALNILTKKSPIYFNKDPLQIAQEINSRTFLTTKTVQRYLDQQWYGYLNEYDQRIFWISSLIFIMCFVPILIPIQALSKFIISDQRQLNTWEKKRHVIGWSARIIYRFKEFYRGRAIVRFFYNIVFYILFLTLFSYVLLVDYFPINNNGGQRSGYKNLAIPTAEIFLHILIWSLIFEEGNEFVHHWKEQQKNGSRHIVRDYFLQDKWNIMDLVASLIYLVAFITRFIATEQAFMISKITMCIDLFLWYIRLLHVFFAFERLGPKLLMIFNTMKDLLFFIYFIMVFLVAYSVTSFALITTKHQVYWKRKSDHQQSSDDFDLLNNGSNLWNWRIIRNILDWSVWKVYGEITLETSYYFNNEKVGIDDDAYGVVALLLTIFFVSVASFLLLNVLVALFNVTIQKVHDSAHESWAYHRFRLVTEYNKKTFLPPPLNVFIYIAYPLYTLIRRYLPKTLKTTYGIHDDNEIMKIDSNLFNMVVFNGVDRILRKGFINSVTINFHSPPRISNPSIILYLLANEKDNPNKFLVVDEYILPTNHIYQGQRGVQTILLDRPLKCYEKQFVALAFDMYAGTPDIVKDRNEYSVNLHDFCRMKNKGKSIHFMNYSNKGAAFSFTILRRSSKIPLSNTEGQLLEQIYVNESTDETKLDLFKQQLSNTSDERWNLTESTQNKFEERDNMLRENSIADDYWKEVIDKIKDCEDKMIED
ncbi:hypothetical protein I4U23_015159 [Adineta vaga]|nr:hypothetical protein I4U23_015159 [Adineta vaga]